MLKHIRNTLIAKREAGKMAALDPDFRGSRAFLLNSVRGRRNAQRGSNREPKDLPPRYAEHLLQKAFRAIVRQGRGRVVG